MIEVGDCREVMRGHDAGSVGAIVTDPPYGLEFMGKEWDDLGAGAAWEVGGIGQPGFGDRPTDWVTSVGHPIFGNANPTCAACGGRLRGAKRCACPEPDWKPIGKRRGITDASPVPKPGNLGGFATGDKPSFARVAGYLPAMQAWHLTWATEAYRVLRPGGYLLAFGGTRTYHRMTCALEDAGFEVKDCLCWLYGQGMPKHKSLLKPAWEPVVVAKKAGVGALNIEACRLDGGSFTRERAAGNRSREQYRWGTTVGGPVPTETGRWPANVVIDEEAAYMIDMFTGQRQPGARGARRSGIGYGSSARGTDDGLRVDMGGGGASRFYYCAKATRKERDAGLDGMPKKMLRWSAGDQNPGSFQSDGTDKYARNHHPTVKPIALMRWLVRLVAVPGAVVLDPFAGSGSTLIACALEGLPFVGIERDPEYVEIAQRRIAYWRAA